MAVDIEAMKSAVGYDPNSTRTAFARKWAEQLDDETVELVELFAASRVEAGFGKKGAASAKSLIMRYLATGELSKGKSGQSQRSHIRAFVKFCDKLAAEGKLDEIGELVEDEIVDEIDELVDEG